MIGFLGLDTSNYTTSAAFCTADGTVTQQKRLLPVREGELGLRQSDAVFHHTRQLPDIVDGLFSALPDGASVCAVAASDRPQQVDGVSLAPKIEVADARIDWTAPALTIDRQIRACNPNPVAWTTHRGQRLKVWLGRAQAGTVLAPGVLDVGRRGVNVGTGRGVLELLTVQPAGKRPMEAAAWGRGVGSDPGSFE